MGQINRGIFVWHELLTTDVAAAKKFYGTVVGWKTRPFEGVASGYELWLFGEREVGGVMAITPEMKKGGMTPHWMGHVCVDDVDATLEKAVSLGARVHMPPMDVPGVGRFAVFADPQGAAVSAYTPSESEKRVEEEMLDGHFSWNELATTDWEKALDFYGQLFGWEKDTAMDMGPAGTYQLFKAPGMKRALGGMFNRPPEMKESAFLYYVSVPDIDEAIAKVKAAGGTVLNGPMDIPDDMRIAQCLDSQGAAIAFLGK